MTKIDLGTFGAVIGPMQGDDEGFVAAVAELDGMGYDTIWLSGGPVSSLDQVAAAVRASKRARIATGILSVDRFPADDVAVLYAELEAEHPGRFVVGLGGAHGPQPVPTLNAYLDRLDELGVPQSRRIMAALGPRMLDLAGERASAALPVLVTTGYTEQARARLGDDTTLAVEQILVLEPDAATARSIARRPLGFLGTVPTYQANFRRMGFTDEEIDQLADPLVDSLVCWGDDDAVVAHLRAHVEAGADHVAVSPATSRADVQPLAEWRRLAEALDLSAA